MHRGYAADVSRDAVQVGRDMGVAGWEGSGNKMMIAYRPKEDDLQEVENVLMRVIFVSWVGVLHFVFGIQ